MKNIRNGYFTRRLKENGISTIPEEWENIWFNDNLIDNFISDVKFFFEHCGMTDIDFIKNYATIIFENGQGLLLDQNRMNVYGDNTTPSYTGSFNAYNIIKSLEYQINYSKIIADKIYLSDSPTKESIKII